MVEFMNIFGGGVWSFLKAIMRESVHNDMIVFFYESFDNTEASKPSSWVNE